MGACDYLTIVGDFMGFGLGDGSGFGGGFDGGYSGENNPSDYKLCYMVDDDEFSRNMLGKILKRFGYHVREANDGVEAMFLCKQRTPDIIFLDWNMPYMNGVQFLKKANELEIREDMKIVFLTAECNTDKIMEALEHSPDDYIMKPFNTDLIESKLHMLGLLNK